jgi:hypothetical protein
VFPLGSLQAAQITVDFEGVEDYTDFSISGMTELKTLPLLQGELEGDLESWAKKYLKDDQSLHITITDIDMAGDIQPWRNRYNADIRYIEQIYVPRMKVRYALKDGAGKVLAEGEDTFADLSFQTNTLAPMRTNWENFFYERTLLGDWIRRTFRDK